MVRERLNQEISQANLDGVRQIRQGYESSEQWRDVMLLRDAYGVGAIHEVVNLIPTTEADLKIIDVLMSGLKPEQKAEVLLAKDNANDSPLDVIVWRNERNNQGLLKSLLLGASFIQNDISNESENVRGIITQSRDCITTPNQLASLFRENSDRSDELQTHFNQNIGDFKKLASSIMSDAGVVDNMSPEDKRLLGAASCRQILKRLDERKTTGRRL